MDEWGRDSTAVYVRVSYGVHTSGHGRTLHARHARHECKLRLAAEFRAGLFHPTAALVVNVS